MAEKNKRYLERITVLETEIVETKVLKTSFNENKERIDKIKKELEDKEKRINELENNLEEIQRIHEKENSQREQEIQKIISLHEISLNEVKLFLLKEKLY